jgi:hypothetical protein
VVELIAVDAVAAGDVVFAAAPNVNATILVELAIPERLPDPGP